MIEHFDSPEAYLQAMSDDGIRVLIKSYLHLQEWDVLPKNSLFEKVSNEICETLGETNNYDTLANLLQKEVYRRFLEQNPRFK